MKGDLSQFDDSIQKKLDQIKRSKLNWSQDDMEDGINVDHELSEEEIGQRFTKLRPDGPRQSERGGRGRSVGRGQQNRSGDRRYDGRDERRREGRNVRRYEERDEGQFERDNEQRSRQSAQQPVKRQEKFDGQNADAFPAF